MPLRDGDTARVHYTGTLDDGTVFDSSRKGAPLEVVLGQNLFIPGFENALKGMEAGQRVTVRIPPEQAYGFWIKEQTLELGLDAFPPHIRPEVGMELQIGTENGELDARVTSVGENSAVLDANHPLAGEHLTFDLEVVEIL